MYKIYKQYKGCHIAKVHSGNKLTFPLWEIVNHEQSFFETLEAATVKKVHEFIDKSEKRGFNIPVYDGWFIP